MGVEEKRWVEGEGEKRGKVRNFEMGWCEEVGKIDKHCREAEGAH